jgi:hypothetical protein
VQSSAVGAPIPIVYGTYAIAGNVIWSSGIIEKVSKKKQGGKGGPTQTTKTFSYSVNCAVGVCEGPISGISRIWADAELIYDVREQLTGESDADYAARILASTELLANTEIYLGTADQLPDPTIESFEGVGNVSAFRDLVYVVFSSFQLESYGNRVPNFRFETSVTGRLELEAFTEPGVFEWTKPPGVVSVTVTCIGGGGGGGGGAVGNAANSFVSGGQGGGGGGISVQTFAAASLGATESVIVGSGGNGGPGASSAYDSDGSDGLPGSASSFGVYVTAGGGGEGYRGQNGDYIQVNDNNGGSGATSTGGYGAFWLSNADQGFGTGDKPNGNNGLGPGGGAGGGTRRFFQSPGGVDGGDGADSPDGFYAGGAGGNSDIDDNFGVTAGASGIDADQYVAGPGGGGGGVGGYLSPQEPGASGKSGGIGGRYGGGGGGGGAALSFGPPASVSGDGAAGADGLVLLQYSYAPETTSCVTLGQIVRDLCERSGLAEDQVDVTDLTECVDGYVVSRVMAARDAIGPLRSYGWFDCVESNGVLKWPTRGKAGVFDLSADDLAAHIAGDSRPSSAESDRQQEVELPRRLRVHYAQTAQNYEPGEQSASRLAAGNVEVRDMEVAVAMSDTKGARIADVVLYDLWVSRNRIRAIVDQSWLHLEPADAGTIPLDGRQERARITNIDHALPGLLRLELVRDDDGVYQSYAIGAPAAYAGTGGASISLPGTAELVLLDLPLLRDADNDAGYYAAIRSIGGTSWAGAALFRSSDGGANYEEVAATAEEASVGRLAAALASGPTTIIDEGNELLVDMDSGELESISSMSLLAGLNAAAIGADGRWEIIQFRDAELVGSPALWRLTGLLRGRRGTEWAVGSSQDDDRFVLLDSALIRVAMNLAAIGTERPHKAVLSGTSIDAATAVDFTGRGVALEPFSVTDVTGERSGGDLIINWVRRGRIGSELAGSGVDIPLSEETESYEIDIIDAGSPGDALRTLTSSTQSVTYTEAQQAADFGSPTPAGITVRIYQMSAAVGRGYPTEATL